MKKTETVFYAIVALLLFISCSGNSSLKPTSGGRPYSVLTVGDVDSTLFAVLSKEVKALPQPEPSFDIAEINEQDFNATWRLSRNIVIVHIDSLRYLSAQIRQEKDVYAHPQLVTYINAPTKNALKIFATKNAERLNNQLTAFEMGIRIAALKVKHNPKTEEKIRQLFGIDMFIPTDMQASKQGKDFIWLSNNAINRMLNLCIYKLKGIVDHNFIAVRDSVMRTNIKGETDDMYMTTVPCSCYISQTRIGPNSSIVIKGLWEMHGDAMGGPFVSRVIHSNGATYIVEAFVFAPETKKRNLLKQIESTLYTIKTK